MVTPATSVLNVPGSIGESSLYTAVCNATVRTIRDAKGTPKTFTAIEMSERKTPRPRIGSIAAKFPTPLALIATNSLSFCIRERPMITPTSTAIGQVNAITLGIKAVASCQRNVVGRLGSKNISVYLPPCWRKRITESISQDKRKYGTTARTRYHEIILPSFIGRSLDAFCRSLMGHAARGRWRRRQFVR